MLTAFRFAGFVMHLSMSNCHFVLCQKETLIEAHYGDRQLFATIDTNNNGEIDMVRPLYGNVWHIPDRHSLNRWSGKSGWCQSETARNPTAIWRCVGFSGPSKPFSERKIPVKTTSESPDHRMDRKSATGVF